MGAILRQNLPVMVGSWSKRAGFRAANGWVNGLECPRITQPVARRDGQTRTFAYFPASICSMRTGVSSNSV